MNHNRIVVMNTVIRYSVRCSIQVLMHSYTTFTCASHKKKTITLNAHMYVSRFGQSKLPSEIAVKIQNNHH